MTTSGSTDFSVTRNDLIQAALEKIGVIADGETPSASQYTKGALSLNMLVKAFQADGMPLWAIKQGYVLPTTSTSSISLGPSGGNATLSYVTTTATAAGSTAATTITVSSITGISASDYIGIALTDNSMQWTTVSGAPAGSTITLATGLTSAMSSGARIYTYTTKLQRPLKIIAAFRKVSSSLARSPINVVAKDQIYSFGTLDSSGTPNQVAYDPQLSSGKLIIYPQFYGGDNLIELTFQTPFEDFDASSDEPSFPQEWFLAIVYNLAWVLSPDYGMPPTDRDKLSKEAMYWHEMALSFGIEQASIYFQPNG